MTHRSVSIFYYQFTVFTFILLCAVHHDSKAENVTQKAIEHGAHIANEIKEAATDIGRTAANDATSTLRRIFNLFADIPAKTVDGVRTAAHRVARESYFFANELQDLGAAVKKSAHNVARNAQYVGQKIGQVGIKRNQTECDQLALIFTVPTYIHQTHIDALTELIKKYNEQEILTTGSSDAAQELSHAILNLLHATTHHTPNIHVDVAWGVSDDISTVAEPTTHNSHIVVILNGAYNLGEWQQTVENIVRIQHYAKQNENHLLLLDALENLLKKAIHCVFFKSVHVI